MTTLVKDTRIVCSFASSIVKKKNIKKMCLFAIL